jgi:hypothetical protein
MKRYDVTFWFSRTVSIEVDATNDEDAYQIAWDNIEHNNGEELVEYDMQEVDPHD